jgi:hypothetical protein
MAGLVSMAGDDGAGWVERAVVARADARVEQVPGHAFEQQRAYPAIAPTLEPQIQEVIKGRDPLVTRVLSS